MLRAPASTRMSQEPADSENATNKKPKLIDSSERVGGQVSGNKVNGFQELGLLEKACSEPLRRTVSRESDGKLEGIVEIREQGEAIGSAEAENEKPGFDFDLNVPSSEVAKEGCAQFGRDGCESRTIIDLEAEKYCEEEKAELGLGYGSNGGLGFGLGNAKGDTFGEGQRRSSSREDKGKEKVDNGDWLQLCTGSMLPPRPTPGQNSDDKRGDSLSFGLKH